MSNFSKSTASWFNPLSLEPLCPPRVYEQAVALYHGGHVEKISLSALEDEDGGHVWLLEGEVVDGAHDFDEVSIEMELTHDGRVANWDSICTCKKQYQCKHGAALMLAAAHEGLELLAHRPARAAIVPPTPEQVEAARRVRAMVEQMDAEGFGGCSNFGECEAVCPKDISLDFIARMNRDYIAAKFKGKSAEGGAG